MRMSGAVRLAAVTDAQVIADLLTQLGYTQDGDGLEPRIRRWIEDPSSAAMVWDDSGTVAGVIAVHVCPFFERDGSWGRIAALVVSERSRARGVGAALVTAAEQFAIESECHRMEVTSSRQRPDAHAFYRKRGYVDVCDASGRFLRDLESLPGS